MVANPKDARLHVRLTAAQRACVDRAAAQEGRTVSEFAVAAMVGHAEHVLADRRLFELDDESWAEFQRLLDRPVEDNPRLADLLSRRPPGE